MIYSLRQWYPTGVLRHTRVQWRGVRGAAKYWIYYLFSIFKTKGAAKNFSGLQGAVNQKRLKNTALRYDPVRSA